jgi:hypothetical protein
MKEKIIGIGICMLMVLATGLPVVGTLAENPAIEVEIWNHPPDVSYNGMALRCDRDAATKRTLATDFECNVTGIITRVILYGSWKDDIVGTINLIHLSIHEDIPAAESPTGYSMPGKLLWDGNFSIFQASIFTMGELSWWWDPYSGDLNSNNTKTIWMYSIDIPDSQAFKQLGTTEHPIVYWLDVYVEATGGEFGWKTTENHRIDDAVYYLDDFPFWFELTYPAPHPLEGDSIDLACKIIGKVSLPLIPKLDKRFDIFRCKPLIKSLGSLTYHDITWMISISGGLFWPSSPATFNGTIPSIQPNATVAIQTGILFGFGPIELKITINDQEPVIFKGFMFLFIIIYLP